MTDNPWRIGEDNVVHAHWCPKAEGAIDYLPLRIDRSEERPTLVPVVGTKEMVEHIRRPDSLNGHEGPNILIACQDCVVKAS